ncbi:DUF3596 domain-containing protein [Thiomonas sp.]|uniref:Arm DNA-binding domain-containing protein n=1 Tax=Thiomonas sp. TaxID=2047785 RepID=UPI00260589AC|nr:DUF3596 domain-containing protein [Thiomonas sp.]
MAKVRVRPDNNKLFFDFRVFGHRFREQTALTDTAANRNKLERLLAQVAAEIEQGSFDYRKRFPASKNVARFEELQQTQHHALVQLSDPVPSAASIRSDAAPSSTPLLREFAEIWFTEKEVEWRRSHKKGIRNDLNNILLPRFGERPVGAIAKSDILSFRAELAKQQAKGRGVMLSNRRINKILNPLRQILNEAADRFDFTSPFLNIKQLKVRKTDVKPFSLEEVKLILHHVRADFRNYFTVRFFTGMRTGEIDGLKWKYVDFERKLILVRETVVDGEEEYTKTDGSQRDIQMSQVVFDALNAQAHITRNRSEFVFCTRNGTPYAHKNVTNRVWYPLLRSLGLSRRRPYQCRHTAATLWLAAGESPQWIAMQLGHSTTEMLFRVYARFVPNMTRQDGSAFERLLVSSLADEVKPFFGDHIAPQENIAS